MIELYSERLLLRDYKEEDFEDYARLMMDKETMRYLDDIMYHSGEDARKGFNEVLDDMASAERRMYFFRMETRDTHEFVGSIGYDVTEFTPYGKLVHLGYFSFPVFWNRGYMSEALEKVLEYAFRENDVYRISTGCLAENKASEKVMIKCGLIKEGELKDFSFHEGKMKTRLEYRMLRSEWERLASEREKYD